MNLKLFCFKMVLFGLCTIISCAVPLNIHAIHLSSAPNQADLLLDKIFAVHATRNLPESDYLQAGWALNNATSLQKTLVPQVRKTLHFALGELVRPVEGFMDWEDCPYAVVTPLRCLLPQLLNINCYDTFILGDLKLGPDTYLVLPVEIAEKIESQAIIVTYNPQNNTLREAVDELIFSKGGWHIEMNNEDIEDVLHEAYVEGENVNSLEFFRSLKEGRPWLSVGLRFDPLDGEHYRLSQIEQSLMVVGMQIVSNKGIEGPTLENAYLENLVNSVNEHFTLWSRSMVDFHWCSESQKAYQQIAAELKKWICLIREELRIRECYGKTLMAAPDDLLVACEKLLDQPDELRIFIDQHIPLLSKHADRSE
jgi:hypothetical protein